MLMSVRHLLQWILVTNVDFCLHEPSKILISVCRTYNDSWRYAFLSSRLKWISERLAIYPSWRVHSKLLHSLADSSGPCIRLCRLLFSGKFNYMLQWIQCINHHHILFQKLHWRCMNIKVCMESTKICWHYTFDGPARSMRHKPWGIIGNIMHPCVLCTWISFRSCWLLWSKWDLLWTIIGSYCVNMLTDVMDQHWQSTSINVDGYYDNMRNVPREWMLIMFSLAVE